MLSACIDGVTLTEVLVMGSQSCGLWGLGDGSMFISGITKQDVTVADRHAVAEVILWEENVGKLQ